MNAAHLHLILAHFPIVIVPLGIAILAAALWLRNDSVKMVSLNIFVAAAVFGAAAYLLGEGAEELVEDLAGIVESTVEDHEDSASAALWLTVGLGVLSAAGIFMRSSPAVSKFLLAPILACSILSAGALAYTGWQGGQIRHPEAFTMKLPTAAAVHDDHH